MGSMVVVEAYPSVGLVIVGRIGSGLVEIAGEGTVVVVVAVAVESSHWWFVDRIRSCLFFGAGELVVDLHLFVAVVACRSRSVVVGDLSVEVGKALAVDQQKESRSFVHS